MKFSGWIIRSERFTKMISWFFPVGGITLFPFIVVNAKYESETMIRHERIHLVQQMELLVIGFYLLYLYDWVKHLVTTWKPYEAYKSIRFEQEAYDKQDEVDYLETRKLFAWRSYS
jgi:hypothetical protein